MSPSSLASGLLLAAWSMTLAPQLAAEEPESAAQAKVGAHTFREYCRSCHGAEAKGDGPVGKYLSPKPADLTLIRARNRGEFPFDEVYAAIASGKAVKGHGSSEMPVWGSAFREVRGGQSEESVAERIRQLVHYVQSIQAEAKPRR